MHHEQNWRILFWLLRGQPVQGDVSAVVEEQEFSLIFKWQKRLTDIENGLEERMRQVGGGEIMLMIVSAFGFKQRKVGCFAANGGSYCF